MQVHGLTRERLAEGAHLLAGACREFLEFIGDAELIYSQCAIRCGLSERGAEARIALLAPRGRRCAGVLDTLALARQMHPGQRNSLDALCKRYSVDNSHREYHWRLAGCRASWPEVYLAMTGGQGSLTLSAESVTIRSRARLAAELDARGQRRAH